MSYASPISTTPFANSVWAVVQTSLNDLSKTGSVSFEGYATQADVGISQPIGSKSYAINPTLYAEYYIGAADHLINGCTMALAILDTPSGQVDSIGNPILVSFFNGATVI